MKRKGNNNKSMKHGSVVMNKLHLLERHMEQRAKDRRRGKKEGEDVTRIKCFTK